MRVVRLSVHQASHEAPTRISRQHAEVEDRLVASGVPYTLLRPQSFMQNTLMAAPTVASQGRIYQPMKDGRLGVIDARDIGEVAAKVLTEEGHEGKTYTLTGPAAISFHDVAEALSEVLDREVSYVSIPLERAREVMLGRGIPEWMADALNEYAKAHSEGYSNWTTDDLERLTGPFRHLLQGVRQRLRAGIPQGMIRNPVDRLWLEARRSCRSGFPLSQE